MGSSNMRDLLTAFSPSMDLFAISSGDGRIKIWDTVKGQVQTEFTDLAVSEETTTSLLAKPDRERGHLSIDYTCMNWLSFERKKKRKLGGSLLILGTGSGDVLGVDVSAGQLKWRLSDCHPGGVSAVSFSKNASSVYSAGCDGMVCQIDSWMGNLLGKFKASTKAISSMAVSLDGKIIATAAGQLKTYNSSDHKTMQKFTGHPGAVRCLIFSEDGKYIFSSAVGERYVAIWSVGGSKKQSASCVLAMENPAIFLDSKSMRSGTDDDAGLYVLAISETGVGYFWFGQNVEGLRNVKPTKISISSEDISSKNYKGALPTILAAILQDSTKPASGQVLIAHGLLVKPSFQKILVHYGTDVMLSSSHDGVLLPIVQSLGKPKKGKDSKSGVVVLDRANVEDALLPIPKVLVSHEINSRHSITDGFLESKDEIAAMEVDSEAICFEDRLRSLGLLSKMDDVESLSKKNSSILSDIELEALMPQKKMKAAVLSKAPADVSKLLGVLVAMWQSGSWKGKHVVPWIYAILVNHSRYVISEEPILNTLLKICKSRGSAILPLLQLSGRLQLVTTQINKALQPKTPLIEENEIDESEEEDEDVDDLIYKEDNGESEISCNDDS